MSTSPVKGFVALLRMPYWLMTGGLSLLTAFAITKGMLAPEQMVLIFLSMAFITSAGFAINDFFDRESDAVIKPKRPIPSGALTLKQVIVISSVLFAVGLIMAYLISWLGFAIIAIDSVLLLFYSYLVKRKSGFAANILVGILTGTAFMYGGAAVIAAGAAFSEVMLVTLSLYPIAFGTIGGNVLRDILSLEGDTKVGYPTLPQKIGSIGAAKVGALFFMLTGLLAPLPYFIGKIAKYVGFANVTGFSIFYLPFILMWSVLLIYSSIRLATAASTIQNVRKYERVVTMSMILLPLALIVEAIVGILL
ncbi:MAG: UbiA family prenyltransferase [Candidatus Bathyarchaeota archaeon]|uniref:UbiA family prenyltransferase n=1 Tax=Candidatus Bathycorpusculum sp. TaxID=2994959 RepID=UPI00282114CF|nr:UbiA family prenyltransferase [Candidatus Termiticorpusculum sp.]MCL2256613.1 UbiA family prenyltransferase [Candidatus Termiticorpusculum sp.]MCL2293235.1 UbiA family prenyltransferase [Candidatus Termiticorpusculum sp.]